MFVLCNIVDSVSNDDSIDYDEFVDREYMRQWLTSMNFLPENCDVCNGEISFDDRDFDIDNYLHCVECRKWYHTQCTSPTLFAQCNQCLKCIHIQCAQNQIEWVQSSSQSQNDSNGNDSANNNNNNSNSVWTHIVCAR